LTPPKGATSVEMKPVLIRRCRIRAPPRRARCVRSTGRASTGTPVRRWHLRNRLLVQRDPRTSSSSASRARRRTEGGRRLTPGVDVGPLIDEPGRRDRRRHIADAKSNADAELVCGNRLDGQFSALLLSGSRASRNEQAGDASAPVAGIRSFRDRERRCGIAHEHAYGLSATSTPSRTHAPGASEALEYGHRRDNTGFHLDGRWPPFGGVKESGIGREAEATGIDESAGSSSTWPWAGSGSAVTSSPARTTTSSRASCPSSFVSTRRGHPAPARAPRRLVARSRPTSAPPSRPYTTLWRYARTPSAAEKRAASRRHGRWQAFRQKVQR